MHLKHSVPFLPLTQSWGSVGNLSSSSWDWDTFLCPVFCREICDTAQPSTWRLQITLKSFPCPCSTFHPCGLMTSSRALPSLWYLAKLGSTQLPFSGWIFCYKILVILPSFWQSFSQMLNFAFLSPQRRNWDLLSHSKILCFSEVFPLISCIKNLSKSVFWCSPFFSLRSLLVMQAKHWEGCEDWDNVFKSWRLEKPILSYNRCYWTYGTAEGTYTRTINILQIFMSLTQWVGFL